MEFLKCNLYIVGSQGIGKSFFRRALDEYFHYEKRAPTDKYNGQNWIIRTENSQVEVEIKDYNNFNSLEFQFETKETKSVVLYITEVFERKHALYIPQKDIEELRYLSKNAKIIISPMFMLNNFEKNININSLKKLVPFVEYFLPIHDFHFREFEGVSQFAYVLRQLLINTHSSSLDYTKAIITKNFETKEPTLDLGNLGLTSLNDVKELFQNTHLTKLILSNEWGEYSDGSWVRRISKNKLDYKFEPNILFGFPKEFSKLNNL